MFDQCQMSSFNGRGEGLLPAAV